MSELELKLAQQRKRTQELDAIVKSQTQVLDQEEEVLKKNMGCSIDCLEFTLEFEQLLKSFREEETNKKTLMPFNQNGMKLAKLKTSQEIYDELTELKTRHAHIFGGE